MKGSILLLLPVVIIIGACHKDCYKDPGKPNPSPGDIPAVKLKDLNERNLPSPYYHFEYNSAGLITLASFSSGLGIYEVIYDGNHIARMENKNEPNRDILVYEYRNGLLSTINIKNVNGIVYRRVVLTVNASHQLQKLDWEVLQNGRFIPEQYQQYSYYADGNLKELTQHYYPVGPQTDHTYTDKFEQYDDKVNPESFALLHPLQDMHLILIPSFTLQKNNARRVTRTGDGVNYEVDYSFIYDAANRPQVKTGQLLFTNTSASGQRFEVQSTYSYYD